MRVGREQRLTLRERVNGLKHLNSDEHRKRHRIWCIIFKDSTIKSGFFWIACSPVKQLVIVDLWTLFVHSKPPDHTEHSSNTNVKSLYHIAEQRVSANNWFITWTWIFLHNTIFWAIKAKRNSWETICNQIDPKQLDRQQHFRQAKDSCDENCHHLTNVGRNQITDKLLCVIVNVTTFFNRFNNCGKVVISQHHLGSTFGNSSTCTHCNTNIGLLECRCIVNTISSHCNNRLVHVKRLHHLLFVNWLHTCKKSGSFHDFSTLLQREFFELSTSKCFTSDIFVISKNTNLTADCSRRLNVITSDDNDTNTSTTALFNGTFNLCTRRINDTTYTNKNSVLFKFGKLAGLACNTSALNILQRHIRILVGK
mmetsp:Transcript_5950/g.9245  ORF Transcript_5950/g.9245 Transcript_5950/m.9245 type:complete len:367 (-) Transcript_5950:1975-3075(-)